jgi:hypothetical protein
MREVVTVVISLSLLGCAADGYKWSLKDGLTWTVPPVCSEVSLSAQSEAISAVFEHGI